MATDEEKEEEEEEEEVIRRGLSRQGEWRERRMEWVGIRKPSLDTKVRSGGELVRKEREEERCLAWLAASILLTIIVEEK